MYLLYGRSTLRLHTSGCLVTAASINGISVGVGNFLLKLRDLLAQQGTEAVFDLGTCVCVCVKNVDTIPYASINDGHTHT